MPSLRLPVLLLVTLLVPTAASARQAGTIDAQKIFAALELRDGSTVCEMGAGDGELSIAAARAVGMKGRVYTSELGSERVKALREKVERSGLAQITVVDGDPLKTNFTEGACDALFMRNVYHHFEDPAVINSSIAASLKDGARLAIVDFGPPPGKEASRPADRGKDGMHGITAPTLERELKEAGFQPVSSETGTERWFMIVVSKPKAQDCDAVLPWHERNCA
jgi:ubiquinone/menaquinone biosynthesis C-methylase UbiE